MGLRSLAGAAALLVAGMQASFAVAGADMRAVCRQSGIWVQPGESGAVQIDAVLNSALGSTIVLLGETHGDADTHRWQLHTLAALRGQRPKMVIGFEMFPRAVQPALDRWVAGIVEADTFLEEAQWARSWGFATEHYLPLFQFARLNRLPMHALNVDRLLVSEVSRVGWENVPLANREGVGDPAPASDAYRAWLQTVWEQGASHGSGATEADDPKIAEERFGRFVEAQLTWDRAMAEGLVEAQSRRPDALAVGVMGRGHVEHRYGVARQLADLGENKVSTMIPVFASDDCEQAAESRAADWLFVIAPSEADAAPPPRLGVIIEDDVAGVRVREVMAGSVAESAMLAEGDIITTAASVPLKRTTDLIEIIGRQASGTWLPMNILRAGRDMEIIAKFPATPE